MMAGLVKRMLAAGICVILASAGVFVLAAGSKHAGSKDYDGRLPFCKVVNPGNKAFYNADGSFNAAAAKKACYAMMRAFHYPIPKVLKTKQFWVCDFVQRDFAKLGMGGIFWMNEHGTYGQFGNKVYHGKYVGQKFGFLGHEIFLLPGQMLPEHRHMGGPQGYPPKMEAWLVRRGSVDFFGQYKGAGDETLISAMPADQRPWGYGQAWFKCRYVAHRNAGETYHLSDPETWHAQRAGPNGAIVTEFATYHNDVHFSKPGMEFSCSKAK